MRLKPKRPVVFNNVTDPVSAGFVESLAEPGGNATGFTRFEYTLAGKWLELLKKSTRMHCFSSSRRAWRWMPSAQM